MSQFSKTSGNTLFRFDTNNLKSEGANNERNKSATFAVQDKYSQEANGQQSSYNNNTEEQDIPNHEFKYDQANENKKSMFRMSEYQSMKRSLLNEDDLTFKDDVVSNSSKKFVGKIGNKIS